MHHLNVTMRTSGIYRSFQWLKCHISSPFNPTGIPENVPVPGTHPSQAGELAFFHQAHIISTQCVLNMLTQPETADTLPLCEVHDTKWKN